jgi:hypothetical protein
MALASCGYSIRKNPAVQKVRIGNISNLTYEPGLQDTFILALERELTRLGVRVDRLAAHSIDGNISSVSIRGIAEANDVTVQYEVKTSGSFTLTGPDNKPRELKGRDSFLINFTARGELHRVMASKETAIKEAINNLARDIAAEVATPPRAQYGKDKETQVK